MNTAEWAVRLAWGAATSEAVAEARSKQLADVVKWLKQIDEATKAGKELSGGKLK